MHCLKLVTSLFYQHSSLSINQFGFLAQNKCNDGGGWMFSEKLHRCMGVGRWMGWVA